jgi:hypothetical protein
VGYVPIGDRGAPLALDEEPLAHRRRLVLHLTELVALDEGVREGLLRELAVAEEELARGDRVAAKRRIDAVHRRVEEATTGSPGPRAAAPD